MIRIFTLIALLLLPLTLLGGYAFAQAASAPSTDPSVLFPQLLEAAKTHNWYAVVGLAIGLLIILLSKIPAIDSRFPPGFARWVPAICAVLAPTAGSLIGGGKWYEALAIALIAAIAALLPSPKQGASQ